ncbi:hypothetical protein ACROYT_G036406 [Oculina patagonica]
MSSANVLPSAPAYGDREETQLYPSLPTNAENFRLTEISKIEKEISAEAEHYRLVLKKYKKVRKVIHYSVVCLGAVTAALSSGAVATSLTGVGIVIGAPVAAVAAVSGAASTGLSVINKKLERKVNKHSRILALAVAKHDSINSSVSQALNDNRKITKTRKPNTSAQPVAEFKSTAVLPYVKGLSEQLRRCLQQQGVRAVFKSETTLRSQLVRPKDAVDSTKQDGVVYRIPCECGKVYIGETGRPMQDRIKEHDRDIRLARTQTSAVAEHTNNTGHYPLWNEVKFIDRDSHWYTRRVKEAIHIRLHPNNINRDSGIEIPEAWMPTIKKHNNRRTVRLRTAEGATLHQLAVH